MLDKQGSTYLVKSEVAHKHTASLWIIIIQWTSHDDLTEKSAETFFILQTHFTSLTHKTREMTKIQNRTLRFDEKTATVVFCLNCLSAV